jgi:hypothetical protein
VDVDASLGRDEYAVVNLVSLTSVLCNKVENRVVRTVKRAVVGSDPSKRVF